MNTDSISGAYSRDIVYGQLSYPFVPQNIKVNSYTPENPAVKAETSQTGEIYDFLDKKLTKETFSLEKAKETYNFGIKQDDVFANPLENDAETFEFPPESISSFSFSSLSSKDIVAGALKSGYSTEQAITIDKARKAYENSITMSKHPTRVLSTHSYTVS